MGILNTHKNDVVQQQDVARWITFPGFWGTVSYILACISLGFAHKKKSFCVHTKPVLLGMGIHVGSFIAVTSIGSAAYSLIRGKRTTELAQKRVQAGSLEQSIPVRGVTSAVSSMVPLALAIMSLKAAERLTNEPAIESDADVDWLRAITIMSTSSGTAAMTVSRIVRWVARDARGESV
jgi:hypothetical protein